MTARCLITRTGGSSTRATAAVSRSTTGSEADVASVVAVGARAERFVARRTRVTCSRARQHQRAAAVPGARLGWKTAPGEDRRLGRGSVVDRRQARLM